MQAFNFFPAASNEIPILVSVPHCGLLFPPDIEKDFSPDLICFPDDTDWWVNELYDFAPALGMGLITARFSRWVIDLNRDPENKSLYSDGRIITALCPATTFLGEPLYLDGRSEVAMQEVAGRITDYYLPYHQKIEKELQRLKNKFGVALLWDCHSIRQYVPTIQAAKFPDLILGDADGNACAANLSEVARASLASSNYDLSYNHPFKGGYITRHFGRPEQHLHALQLEMTKVNYMNDTETNYNVTRADKMKLTLKATFERLSEILNRQ